MASILQDDRAVLRVFFTNLYPFANNNCSSFPNLVSTTRCPNPGIMTGIFGLIGKEINKRIEPYVVMDGDYNQFTLGAALKNQPGAHLTGLRNNSYDTIGLPFQKTAAREKEFDFTDQILSLHSQLYMSRKETETASWWSMFRIYDSNTWILLIFLMVFQATFSALIRHLENKNGIISTDTPAESFWKIVRLQLFQADRIRFTYWTGNINAWFVGLLQCTIMFGLFSSWFLSSMMSPQKKIADPLSKVLSDLETGKRHLLTTTNYVRDISDDERGTVTELIKRAVGNKKVYVFDNPHDAIDDVRHHNGILMAQSHEYLNLLALQYCEIVPVPGSMRKLKMYLMFSKNNTNLQIVNKAINAHKKKFTTILLRYIHDSNLGTICEDFRMGEPMPVESYIGLLILCLSSLVLSIVIFSTEMFLNKLKLLKIEQSINKLLV